MLGIAAQWLAWRLRLPSILVLLLVGFLAGPVTGFLNPDALLGDLVSPMVSIAVAMILFEGGLSLKLPELAEIGGVVRRLISIGVLITWVLASIAAHLLLQLDIALSILLGAILTVTGPTVIVPLLRDIRAIGRVQSILRWEGILIDPIGVMLAVLVFEVIVVADLGAATSQVVSGLFLTLGGGSIMGIVLGVGLTALLRRYWIPDYLQNAVAVMTVVGAFVGAELVQAEAGLVVVTVMGIVMANQKVTPVRHIIEFKENLGVMLISTLFILLAARLELDALAHVGLNTVIFVALLIVVIRPLVVFVSTIGSGLKWQEKAFIAALAPRGIVAAASASLFALELSHFGYEGAEILTPITFTVIIATVAIYGLSARPLAKLLGVAQDNPQGILFVGAHAPVRAIALGVQNMGYRVLLVDSNWENIQAARMEGLDTHYGNILNEDVDSLDLNNIGRMLAMTPNDEVNSLAALHFREVFGRSEVYQLACQPSVRSDAVPQHMRGRLLFASDLTYRRLQALYQKGVEVRTTPLTDAFTFSAFRAHYQEKALPLFLRDDQGQLLVFATDRPPIPRSGHAIVSLIQAEPDGSGQSVPEEAARESQPLPT